ncbi:bifunctional (p)ppGpp synthetase/guanosine-3',5'-bis(diphosphate) 3'-pyrophosphohydrolase [uncultured Duncaniella sp.]|jgi:GTP pyrophosphokinase|uniref:RelA/SpoT family protein n=1 Tax=uncultured Duncaniella sp. TaxID=2768039 RepID=UPI002675B02F|nr:HD domain-containing protein [uncultured Duncaniella sp.]MCI9173197.1 bifunctional (p)ppGpp synthetase/guanosine-3',5'-bis(diphosphate) 3'-pyrophosphohydrolase [Muribaculaceae bacterium]
MVTSADYDKIIQEKAQVVLDAMAERVSASDLQRIREAFELARFAHADQKRKTGEPYILHPIAVATICAKELMLDTNPVMAAFLHDVVEDTHYTMEDIESRFGHDVAFLVRVVTKQKKDKYDESKQVDNYKQMLDSVQYDIRALLVKLADRLHNMRTLSSMRPDKQMKIAGETDYFYAPLANRLGLYNVKTELENLSLKFRCPHEFADLTAMIKRDEDLQRDRLRNFCEEIRHELEAHGIKARVFIEYRQPYSLWRKMRKYGDDFNHLKYRHFTEVVFDAPEGKAEKEMVMRIYSILTDRFKEKPGGIANYIDSPKENGYQSYHVKLLASFGRWQEVHISSERMVRDSQLGCVASRNDDNIWQWIKKFRMVLRDIAARGQEGTSFIEEVVRSFYNDDIMTFTPQGKPIILPQRATVMDFAFEVHTQLGLHAKYARINNQLLASVKTRLHRGDIVEIFTDPDIHPAPDWLDTAMTYKARKAITTYLKQQPKPRYDRCPECNPMPGEELIGFKNASGRITLHKRDCPVAIRLASQMGDNIVSVDFQPDSTLYPVTINIRAVDRYHLLIDLVDCITNDLNLSIDNLHTVTEDAIVTCSISFLVHSFTELQSIMRHIAIIPGVDEVKRALV